MFDMGFTEMMLIGIVALVVIGPERLPGVARTAGKYVGRLKRFMTSVKSDVEQELRADELRQILSDQQKELDSLKNTISDAGRDIERQANLDDAISDTAAPATEPVAETVPEPASVAADAAPAAEATGDAAPTEPPKSDAASKQTGP